jgi:hypothetical protein
MNLWRKFYNQLKDPILITVSRCVDEGYCSTQQADLIQQYVEKKLRKLYKIDETIGKSLLTIDDEDEDEDNPKDRKSMMISDDDNSPLSSNDNHNSLITETTKNAHTMALSPPLTSNNRFSPSPSKDDLSPGEITKGISPSSLSEASPILD